ncbi:MAG: hypothetical protein JSW58_00360, partial [Candidatus Latescibacterota bacterium]
MKFYVAARLFMIFVFCVVISHMFAKPSPAVSQPSDPTAATDTGTISATMRGIFTALVTAYSYSLDKTFFEDRHNRDTVLAALQALVNNTEALEAHGGGLDPSFDYLRHSLAKDAFQALEQYQKRQYLGSQFTLTKLMDNCA